MKQANTKYTILYGRLSQEDMRQGESNSIQNQRLILEKYAEENGFENYKFMFDDGVSGTTFNRLAWNEVMEMIENNMVENLIVKDLSRLGRDYLQTGHLMEIVFPNHNVRFIAISNNVDSLLQPDNDMSVFYNIMNDFYAKDCSKKIKAVKKAQAERGERIGAKPPYGYEKSILTPKQMIPDEGCADVVRKIFQLCINGRGPKQIATQLEKEQILNPSNYYFRKTGVELLNLNTTNPYKWSHKTVARMIADEVYLGHTITRREKVISYKNKKKIQLPKEEWLKFENTHEPLVTKEQFDIAQSVRQQKKRAPKKIELSNVFSGLIRCSDCGKPLGLQRYHTQNEDKFSFRCSANRTNSKICSGHTIKENQLSAIILDDLKRVTHFARQNEKLFAEHINQKNSTETRKEIARIQKEIRDFEYRDMELKKLFKRIYEDNIIGKLPDEIYVELSKDYFSEQKELREMLPKLEEQLENLKNSLTNVEQFIQRAKQYTNIKKLTSEILNTFIDKVVVGERAEKYSPTAQQSIWIYYRDLGLLDGATDKNDIEPPTYDFELLENGELVAI